jgi:hypothetical protein
MQRLSVCIFLVGVHSLVLGVCIFFFTEPFYDFFFGVEIENFFFVKQAGLFIFCVGMFYFAPLKDLNKQHRAVDLIIITKTLAVLFLITNAHLVIRPEVIILAAVGDGIMAVLLAAFSYAAGLLFKR